MDEFDNDDFDTGNEEIEMDDRGDSAHIHMDNAEDLMENAESRMELTAIPIENAESRMELTAIPIENAEFQMENNEYEISGDDFVIDTQPQKSNGIEYGDNLNDQSEPSTSKHLEANQHYDPTHDGIELAPIDKKAQEEHRKEVKSVVAEKKNKHSGRNYKHDKEDRCCACDDCCGCNCFYCF